MTARLQFEAWEAGVKDGRRADPLWRMTVYRLASYAREVGWDDARALDQICRILLAAIPRERKRRIRAGE